MFGGSESGEYLFSNGYPILPAAVVGRAQWGEVVGRMLNPEVGKGP